MTVAAAPATRDYLDATRPLVEATIGRPLRRAEQHVDVFGLTRALDDAKNEIDRAIRAEQRRAIARGLRDSTRIRLRVTRPMLAALEKLYRHGRREALAELQRAGYPVATRALAAGDASGEIPELADLEAKVGDQLRGLSVKVESQRVTLNLGGAAQQAIATALLRVPGGRSIAAGAVSTALFNGMGATFEEHADLVPCWEYSSVLDGGTCDVCAPLDGTEYHSLDDLFDVLPDFGPNPDCEGGDRCRCRAVPCDASEAGIATGPPTDEITNVLNITEATGEVAAGARAALDVVATVHTVDADALRATVRVVRDLPVWNPGQYDPRTPPPKIRISHEATDPGFTTLHETGHYLDQMIGDRRTWASNDDPRLQAWRDAIDGSQAVRTLRSWLDSPPEIPLPSGRSWRPDPTAIDEYYLTDEELFARSYSQWVATRSADPQLRAELRAALQSPYPEQWHDDDFAPIAQAFEALMEELGWLKT